MLIKHFGMMNKFRQLVGKKIEIFGLVFLITFTGLFTTYFNYNKNSKKDNYNNFLDNIYLKKNS